MSIEVKTSSEFAREIEQLVKNHSLEYMDAVLHYCEKNEIEIESIAALVRANQTLKSKIQIEAEDLNFLPRSARLPL
jgi:mevalonate kinase